MATKRIVKGTVLYRNDEMCAVVTKRGSVRGYEDWPELFDEGELVGVLEKGERAFLVSVTYTVIEEIK